MKICYVTNYLPTYHSHVGGAEQAILRVEALIKERSVKTYYLTLPFSLVKKDFENITPIFTLENLFKVVGKYIEILKWYVLQFDPFAFFLAKRFIKKIRPDVLHFGNFQFLTFSVLYAAKQCKIPVFISVYDYWYFCPLTTLLDYKDTICRRFHGVWCIHCLPTRMRFLQFLLLAFRKKIFDYFLKKVDKFIVLSHSSERILMDYGIEKERISVIKLPLPLDFVNLKQEGITEKRSILFVGWLQKRKGLHILLDAMSLVWKEFPEAKLYIVTQKVKWEQTYENLIMSQIKDLPPEKCIFLLGRQSSSELKNLMQKATVIIIPELWENMSPLILLEAMAMSKAIIASNIGGIPEFIEDHKDGLLANPFDSKDFAKKISYLFNNEQVRQSLGRNAYEKILIMLDKDIIINKYIQEYEKSRID